MQKTRRPLVWALVVLAAALAAGGCKEEEPQYGSGAPGGQPPGFLSVDEIVTELSLTPDQDPVVREILTDAEDQRNAIMSSVYGRQDRDAMVSARTKVEEVLHRTDAELELALDENQMTRYRELVDEAREAFESARAERGGRGPGGGRGKGGRGGGF